MMLKIRYLPFGIAGKREANKPHPLNMPANMDAEVYVPVRNTKSKIFLDDVDITSKSKKLMDSKSKLIILQSGKYTIKIVD